MQLLLVQLPESIIFDGVNVNSIQFWPVQLDVGHLKY